MILEINQYVRQTVLFFMPWIRVLLGLNHLNVW